MNDFTDFGDVCRMHLGMQCQYGSRYANPEFSTVSAKEAGHYRPYCGEGLRIQGDPAQYHSLKIHNADVAIFVARVKECLNGTRN